MGRSSIKKNKNIYQKTREELHLTRERASELLEFISAERIERIENEKVTIQPDEVLKMSQVYAKPLLCNYFCSNQCVIGKQYVPEIKIKDLSCIILEMLSSLNTINNKKERLIEISSDGQVTSDEIDDFIYIQDELEKISITVETLQLWTEKMLAIGTIDTEKYNEKRKSR